MQFPAVLCNADAGPSRYHAQSNAEAGPSQYNVESDPEEGPSGHNIESDTETGRSGSHRPTTPELQYTLHDTNLIPSLSKYLSFLCNHYFFVHECVHGGYCSISVCNVFYYGGV